ncbi:MAG TPA: Ig-like domain-containing protein, partial [Candidatus Baltobacteraceae bacterium]|nr:Ig-like domain-containing protein [Candidatus Baltobacteraceae bacterium]
MRMRFAVASFAVLAALAACGRPGQPERPPSIEALPAPSLPPWIAQIAPAGTAQPQSQIRVLFTQPLLAVQAMGSAQESAVLSHFRLDPAVGGAFVVLTPRMVAYQTDAPLPPSTRFRVTLTAGLKDVRGDGLSRDLAWTFATQPLQFSLPDAYATPSGVVGLRPVVPLQLNADVDRGELAAHAYFRNSSDGSKIQAAVTAAPSPPPGAVVYDLSPQANLAKYSHYDLIVDAGLLPLHGNLPAADAFRFPLQTYGDLDFIAARPTSNPYSEPKSRFAGGDPAFAFSNALDPKTYAAHVRVEPSPQAAGKIVSLSDDGNAILINPYALRPQTGYRVAFDAGLLDVFGQRLGRTVEVPFTTPELAPYFWAPEGQYTFVAGQQLQLEYTAVNLPGNQYRAAYRALQPEEIAAAPYSAGPDRLPQGSWPVRTFSAQRDRETQIRVPLQSLLGGPFGLLAYGAQPFANRTYGGTVQITNLGVFAQLFPGSIDVAVQHLDDGAPVRRAAIELYVPHTMPNGPAARLCARAQTGDDGTFSLTGPLVESCYAQSLPDEQAPALLVVAREGSDWAYALVEQWSGIYEYSSSYMEGAWTAGAPVSRGTIFSDRQMYQPGERGWFTAVCYVLQNGTLHADRGAAYTLKLRDPDGNTRTLPGQTSNRFATFSFPIDFSKTQTPGYYTLEATSPDGARITGGFRVAHFRPPNFAVDLKLDKAFAAAGSSVQASGSSHYLFGAPMSGAQASLHVTRTQSAYSPPGRDDYTFGRQWPWPDQPPDLDSDVLTQAMTLDSSGAAAASVPVAADLPYAMTYNVDLEATDVSHLATSATQSFTALPATSLIGLKGDFVGSAGSPISAAAIVTDPQGKAVSGSHVHVLLQKIEFSGVTQV